MEMLKTTPDRLRRFVPHGAVFGMAGTGKTTLVIDEIIENKKRRPEDIICVIDPNGEYEDRLNMAQMSKEVAVMKIGVDAFVNPCFMAVTEISGEASFLTAEKGDFFEGLVEMMVKRPLTSIERSHIHTAVHKMYGEYTKDFDKEKKKSLYAYLEEDGSPTLGSFYECLVEIDNALAVSIEPYVNGFLARSTQGGIVGTNFGETSDMTIYIYDLSEIPDSLKSMVEYCCYEYICQKTLIMRAKDSENKSDFRYVWLYMEQFETYLRTASNAQSIKNRFKSARKLGLNMMFIMQSMHTLVGSIDEHYSNDDVETYGRAIFNNIGHLYIFRQSPKNAEELKEFISCEEIDDARKVIRNLNVGECVYDDISQTQYMIKTDISRQMPTDIQ